MEHFMRVEGARPRCPFCHDEIARAGGAELGPGEQPTVCPGCHALHHLACWDEAGACASCGTPRSDAPPPRARSASPATKGSPPPGGKQTFIYEAVNGRGQRRWGELRAHDQEAALQQIQRDFGLFPTRCRTKLHDDDTFEVARPAARGSAVVKLSLVILAIGLLLTGVVMWFLLKN